MTAADIICPVCRKRNDGDKRICPECLNDSGKLADYITKNMKKPSGYYEYWQYQRDQKTRTLRKLHRKGII